MKTEQYIHDAEIFISRKKHGIKFQVNKMNAKQSWINGQKQISYEFLE